MKIDDKHQPVGSDESILRTFKALLKLLGGQAFFHLAVFVHALYDLESHQKSLHISKAEFVLKFSVIRLFY